MEEIGSMQALHEAAAADSREGDECFPDQLSPVLDDPQLQQILQKRFASGDKLREVREMGFSIDTGLISMLLNFRVSKAGRRGPGVLVMSDIACRVRAVVDDFEPVPLATKSTRANKAESRVPFAVSRRASLLQLQATRKELQPYFEKVKAYRAKLGLSEASIAAGDHDTKCTYETEKCTGYAPTGTMTGCTPDPDRERDCTFVADSETDDTERYLR
jgi:hypothetical protein